MPPQLEELIAQLLSLNPAGRCRTAAEVFVRLSPLSGLEEADDAEFARAYLATPALVGREPELGLLRRHLVQAARGRGATLLVDGAAGVGRSRLLDASVLDGQLMGALVLRTSAAAGASSSFELIRRLCLQLLEARPTHWPKTPRLSALLSEERSAAPADADSAEEHGAIQRSWSHGWCRRSTRPCSSSWMTSTWQTSTRPRCWCAWPTPQSSTG